MDIKMLSIDDIGLSNRCRNALHAVGVHTVGELLGYTEESLRDIRNLGRKSIDQILERIEEYKQMNIEGAGPTRAEPSVDAEKLENFDAWVQTDLGRDRVLCWLKNKNSSINELQNLSAKGYNLLWLNGYTQLHQIVFLKESELLRIPRMDDVLVSEIVRLCRGYLDDHKKEILEDIPAQTAASSILDLLNVPEYHGIILKYVKTNDKKIEDLGLSNRPINCLHSQGYNKLSDIIFLTRAELREIPSMGINSIDEVMAGIKDYLSENETRLIAVCTGNKKQLLDDDMIRDLILQQYRKIGFSGLTFKEIMTRLHLPQYITEDRVKKIIGSLLAAHELEYVDSRCYRVYEKFSDFVESCDNINERGKNMIRKKIEGATLESLAQQYRLTRERVRQIIKRDVDKIRQVYRIQTGNIWFDEDYFRYFYAHYAVEKRDAAVWLGMTSEIYNYLELMDVTPGREELEKALDDQKNLDLGLRLRIKNYLNRNKLYIDGMWVEKRRADLEEVVVRKFCTENTSFQEFGRIYNDFLKKENVEYDENIYYTDSVLRSRKNQLADARFLLWKQNEQIRYYDIESHDFTELLDTLNLEAYENIQLSTLKFVEQYPEILQKYDIRDQYELHNLLRKIVPEGSYHDFRCGRMPSITFGVFDRDSAILDILIDNAPIQLADLCNLIHSEYGYDPSVIRAYLGSFSQYYHQGVYQIDQEIMPEEHKAALKKELTEDFYYIDEIRKIYHKIFPDASLEAVNPYNLKMMGFVVLSQYVVQNYPSLEALCEDILTREDILDLRPYKRRFVQVQMFSQKLRELKRNLQVVEFEPDQIITFRKLEQCGITREMIRRFCDAVYAFVQENSYFSIQSLRQDGFTSELYKFGFSDWFYANILISDDRFSYSTMFRNMILYKGCKNITIQSFEVNCIKAHGSIDTYDLMTELSERFGCHISDRFDILYKVRGTDVYYDEILDRLYMNADLYYRELDAVEEL